MPRSMPTWLNYDSSAKFHQPNVFTKYFAGPPLSYGLETDFDWSGLLGSPCPLVTQTGQSQYPGLNWPGERQVRFSKIPRIQRLFAPCKHDWDNKKLCVGCPFLGLESGAVNGDMLILLGYCSTRGLLTSCRVDSRC